MDDIETGVLSSGHASLGALRVFFDQVGGPGMKQARSALGEHSWEPPIGACAIGQVDMSISAELEQRSEQSLG
ncbi:hypothetical protein [Actinokineospora sp. HUAS TT18]|uniref:hypothetical protein n=1 Tax=Actinokineospora sp. HUAS TT18 TaxID=3447451 RepID=UPI003F52318F